MVKKVLMFCAGLLIVSGCASDEGKPQITSYTPARQTVSPVSSHPSTYQPPKPSAPSDWVPPSSLEKKWTAIIVHHSGSASGNMAIFDKWHREGRHWDSVGYDFVIGNGSDSGDGQVEVTVRWTQQVTGAHVGGTPDNWANKDGIGICLVGNFDQTTPTPKQMQSLAKLVNFLQQRYKIPTSRIYGHGTTPGIPHKTDCPGKHFSMSRLKSMLK